ncbi:unnamed protein product [Zymoseptoria tritici ST99CH_3D7]|uniref:RmlD-like substrate binding domain-containing protein n=1 Tax=Zymoseptoria tritici (strain ST99CH_3D7) TaxID=1276538 RepID=A0A1X7RV01_ZYMT9|nr:unnamed protein product [Zymoseptoria tritici ST99CH_3D7]
MSSQPEPIFLVWGGDLNRGWIGQMVVELLKQQGKNVHSTMTRMEEQSQVRAILDDIKPTHVINCAGKTGRPTVDWCESHQVETMETNCLGVHIVTSECHKRDIHCTIVATGCIYTSTYDPTMTTLLSPPFTESCTPNFASSFYSATKAPIESILAHYPNTLILRLRMPVSADLSPRSFVTKILAYEHIVNIPNSHSILPSLLPIIIALAEHGEEGVYNFTNPGSISHNEVLELYKEIVDPSISWKNFTVEQQSRVIVAERSNCALDAGKLMGKVKQYQGEGVEVELPEVREAYRRCFEVLKKGLGGVQQRGGAA